jgi:glycerate 2-kinase
VNGADPREFLRALFDAAVAAADPAKVLAGRLPDPPAGRTVVVGAGKAAAPMAAAFERLWDDPVSGFAVTPYGHGGRVGRIEVAEAAHPVPDAAGEEAGRRILRLAAGLGADDLLVCLLSGGGSALLVQPAAGISLGDKQAVNRALLRSGATIAEINTVRKHLSGIKGGRLAAAAHPARVATLAISDVPGDDPSVIASGPTVPDSTSFVDALEVLARHGVDAPAAIQILRRGADGGTATETPKPGDPAFARDRVEVVATAQGSLEAAAMLARRAGVATVMLGDDLQSESRELAAEHAALALAHAAVKAMSSRPIVLLSGGETTVTVRGAGRGGRNTEYLLALALALDGHPRISALACDTDGIDGCGDNAGAFALPETLMRARAAGLDPWAILRANDAYTLFAELGDLVVTGPTRTNVNDFRAILVE